MNRSAMLLLSYARGVFPNKSLLTCGILDPSVYFA